MGSVILTELLEKIDEAAEKRAEKKHICKYVLIK